jgi:hypothetical protein
VDEEGEAPRLGAWPNSPTVASFDSEEASVGFAVSERSDAVLYKGLPLVEWNDCGDVNADPLTIGEPVIGPRDDDRGGRSDNGSGEPFSDAILFGGVLNWAFVTETSDTG